MRTAAVALPAWARRLALILVPLAVVGAFATASYFPGGPRLAGGGAGLAAPVTVGEEFHTIVRLEARGGPVTLVKARVVGVDGAVDVGTPTLIRTPGRMPLLDFRGTLTAAATSAGVRYDVLGLPGARLPSPENDRGTVAYDLDVALRPTAAGISRMAAVEVSYQAGFLRARTAVLSAPVCLSASVDGVRDQKGCPGLRP